MQMMMGRIADDENMPIESKMISKTVESSQKKVEGRNFGIRKNTLQYDDVMNRQRQLIYKQRDQVLDGIDLSDKILAMLDTNIEENVKNYFAGDSKADWNVAGLKEKYKGWLTSDEVTECLTKSVSSWATRCSRTLREWYSSEMLIPFGWITLMQWMI